MHTNWATILGTIQPSGGSGSAPAPAGEGVATEGGGGTPAPAAGPCGGQDPMMTIIMLVAMVAAFYFLLIRPQQKKTKEHQSMLGNLKKGDEVVTGGGLVGKVTGVSEKLITIEVSEKVRVRVLKTQVIDKYSS